MTTDARMCAALSCFPYEMRLEIINLIIDYSEMQPRSSQEQLAPRLVDLLESRLKPQSRDDIERAG